MDSRRNDTAQLEALLEDAVPALRRRARALADPTRPRAPEPGTGGAHAWRHGMTALQSAIDHLVAWQLLSHGQPRPIMAHYTLLRGAIDGAAKARWLFDSTVAANVRAGRGYRSELTDMQELDKIDRLDPLIEAEGPPGIELVARVRAEADAESIRIAPWDESGYAALAATYAGYRSIYKGSGAHLYSVLSAAAHGRLWGRHLARQNAILRQEGVPDQRVTIMDPSTALWATRKVLAIVDRAVRDAEVYAGGG